MNALAHISDPVLSGREAADYFLTLLTGDKETAVHVRLIHDSDKSKPALKLYGSLQEHGPQIEEGQANGYGVFIVVNEGGNTDAEISRIRACFIDADDTPLPDTWHLQPDFIVMRDSSHWHAYWRIFNLPVEQFQSIQKCLAAHYGTDPAVCNPSRVMRLAGTLHQKQGTTPVKLIDLSNGELSCLLGHSVEELLAGLPELQTDAAHEPLPSATNGVPFTPAQLTEMLSYLDPDCTRDEWRDIAAALHAATCTDPCFDKRGLFVRWSRGEVHHAN